MHRCLRCFLLHAACAPCRRRCCCLALRFDSGLQRCLDGSREGRHSRHGAAQQRRLAGRAAQQRSQGRAQQQRLLRLLRCTDVAAAPMGVGSGQLRRLCLCTLSNACRCHPSKPLPLHAGSRGLQLQLQQRA